MAQTATSSLPALFNSLTQSLSSSFEATPKLSTLGTPNNGISLLDVKNELLLSYLQNVVFLILLKTRTAKGGTSGTGQRSATELNDAVVKKLVELRLYLEKGVRPLEDKLRYQIEKVLRAVDDVERQEKAEAAAGAAAAKGGKRSEADSDSASGSDDDSSDDEDGDDDNSGEAPGPKIADLQYRPNPAAFVRPPGADDGDDDPGSAARGKTGGKDGIYRPPKIAPTSMPTGERRDRAADRRGKQLRSATMDEFVNDELSVAPVAQPSIGTNIAGRGRHVKTAAERRDEAERQAYEETHFVRLQEGKKERARKEKLAAGGRMNFGGEEWRGLGEGVDRINRLVRGKDGGGGGGGTKALLDKSRKRALETTDGPRGSGVASVDIGERYQKRLKVQELGRTSRGKKR
ncbi:hypothetical protein RB595_006087 [Gaeumannomyces hyphopodioides]